MPVQFAQIPIQAVGDLEGVLFGGEIFCQNNYSSHGADGSVD